MADSEDALMNGNFVDLTANLIEVQCGHLVGHMLMDKFICPGIHQQCIEIDGELISPKEFTIRASKDKQKDWKGSIRIGKSNLRALMEMKKLDFHLHESYCSGKCQSRNYITIKNFTEELNIKSDLLVGPSTSKFDTVEKNQCSQLALAKALQHLASHRVTPGSTQISFAALNSNLNEKYFNLSNQERLDAINHEELVSPKMFLTLSTQAMLNHPVKYWDMVAELDLFNEFVDLIRKAIIQIHETTNEDQNLRLNFARMLSQTAKMLGLESEMNERIYRKRLQFALEENALLLDTRKLEQRVDENYRKLFEARRKIARYDDFANVLTPSPVKRNRLSSEDSTVAH